MFKWLVDNEPVWFADAVKALAGFIVLVSIKYGFDAEIGTAALAVLPVLLAPLTRRATTSNSKVVQAIDVAVRTGDASAGKAVAEVKPS